MFFRIYINSGKTKEVSVFAKFTLIKDINKTLSAFVPSVEHIKNMLKIAIHLEMVVHFTLIITFPDTQYIVYFTLYRINAVQLTTYNGSDV